MDEITSGMKEYLTTVFSIEEGGNMAKNSELAKELQVKPASVTEMIRKMGSTGLLDYKPYHEMKLTEKGKDTVRNILRRHRLLEKMFADFVGLDAEAACDEASKLDLLLSDSTVDRICTVFDHPTTCPCGKPIYADEHCCRR